MNEKLVYNDIRINVPWGYIAGRWYGNRQVRPILALHGWQDNLGTWDRLIPLLPRHIDILCIDFPGHGRSSKYPKGISYHVINFTDIITRIIKEFHWKKVSLMCHSMGGIVALIYTTLYPHLVDILIQIDIIWTPVRSLQYQIIKLKNIDQLIIENDRLDLVNQLEPPLYSYDELEDVLHKGSLKSLEKENCKCLLNRNIAHSKQTPDKYYFSRDGRIKFLHEFYVSHGLSVEMVKRIKNVNYLIVKATKSDYISNDAANFIIKILRQNNPNFKFCEVEGTHYVHVNNPNEVAQEVIPFILKHWSAEIIMDIRAEGDQNGESVNLENEICSYNKKSKL